MRYVLFFAVTISLLAGSILAQGDTANVNVITLRGDATICHGQCPQGHTSIRLHNYSGEEVTVCFTDSTGFFQIESEGKVVSSGNWTKVHEAYLDWLIAAGGYQQYTLVTRKDGNCQMVMYLLGTH